MPASIDIDAHLVTGSPAATSDSTGRNTFQQWRRARADVTVARPGGPPTTTTLTRQCEYLIRRLHHIPGALLPAEVAQLRRTIQALIRQRQTVSSIQSALRTAFDDAFDQLLFSTTPLDAASVHAAASRLFDIRGTIDAVVATTLVEEVRRATIELRTSTSSFAPETDPMKREPTASAQPESQVVIAMAIPQHRSELDPGQDQEAAADNKLRRVQSTLGAHATTASAVLSPRGGTIVLANASLSDHELDELIARLSRAAQVPIIAVALSGPPESTARLSDHAHELLNIAERLHYDGGLYRFRDLALEYQLTRPGPAGDVLAHALDPLDAHPELCQTLILHLHTNMSRQSTARLLQLHRNTVDYRLHRIKQLTGYDPSTPSGLWYLQCALIVRAYRKRIANRPDVPGGTANTTVAISS